MQFEELRIRLWAIGNRRYLVFANGVDSAAAAITLEQPPSRYRQRLDELVEEELGRSASLGTRGTRTRLRELGRELFAILFPDPIRACFSTCLRSATERNRGLRVRFETSLDAPELMDFPFEALCSPAVDPLGNIALRPAISPVRSLPGAPLNPRRVLQPSEEPGALPLLVVAASPAGLDRLDVEGELERLREKLPPHVLIQDPGPPRVGGRTVEEVSQLFATQKERPCAALIIAHGVYDERDREVQVLLEKENGSPVRIDSAVLAGLLVQAQGLRLVVLNLCLGGRAVPGEPFLGLAQGLIAAGIPAVIAMQTAVSDQAATEFSRALFWAIYSNQCLDEAVSVGRRAIATPRQTEIEWANPVLFLHADCGHAWQVKVMQPVAPGEVQADPLREYEELYRRLGTVRKLEEYAEVLPYLRWRKEWDVVLQLAPILQGWQPRELQYLHLPFEAKGEIHLGLVQEFCELLASWQDPRPAGSRLESLQDSLRPEVLAALDAELRRAIALHDQYRRARALEKAEDWSEAAEVFAALPADYRDASARRWRASGEAALDQGTRASGRLAAEAWKSAQGHFEKALELSERGEGDSELEAAASQGRRYAQGRLAVEREDWETALDGLSQAARNAAYRDAGARAAQVRGRIAESEPEPDWPAVIRTYWPIRGELPEVRSPLLYAAGRRAEERLRWAWAARLYGLAGSHADAPRRRRHAGGRAAEQHEDWKGVVAALHDLKDEELGWQVGRCLHHARARLLVDAVETGQARWREAVDELGKIPGEHRDGAASHLWRYARARVAEGAAREMDDGPSWAGVDAALGSLPGDYRDRGLRRPYAIARRAEAEERWEAAASAYGELLARNGGLDDGLEDAPLRRAYSQGRLAEDRGDWQAALEAYGALPAGYRDRDHRLLYARVRAAEEDGSWSEVLAAIEALGAGDPRHPDLPSRAHYARGRLAEEQEDWWPALEHYAAAGDHRDAAARRRHAEGRGYEARGEWRRALERYRAPRKVGDRISSSLMGRARADLERVTRESAERAARLGSLLEALPWLDGLAHAGRVAGPAAEEGDSEARPYDLLEAAGITPASSADEVKNASYRLQECGLWTPAVREAWDRLRMARTRLAVDAGLYALTDPGALLRCQEDLMPGTPEELLRTLCEALPGDAPLFLLLDGREEAAVERFRSDLAARPARHETARHLAIALARRARRRATVSGSGADEQRDWEQALALWARVLGDPDIEQSWREEAAARYRQPVSRHDVTSVSRDLARWLDEEVEATARRLAAADEPERAESQRHLALAFELERVGAALVRRVGGLAGPEAKQAPAACGVLYLRHHGLGALLALRVAHLESEAGDRASFPDLSLPLGPGGAQEEAGRRPGAGPGAVTPITLLRLRCAFSRLGPPLLHLERDEPEATLECLSALLGPRANEPAAEDAACSGLELDPRHLGSCTGCQEMLRHDPAYGALPMRRARRLQDAVWLATRAHLALAHVALVRSRDALDDALREWRAAIEISRRAHAQVRTMRVIVGVVMGRVEALSTEQGPHRGERLDEAVELMEWVTPLVGRADDGRLAGRLAEALTDRGVWYGSGCLEYQEGKPEQAVADLRRALELNPGALYTRNNLARALVSTAGDMFSGGPAARPYRLLAEALGVLEEGLDGDGGQQQLHLVLRQALDTLEERLLRCLPGQEILRRMQGLDGPSNLGAHQLVALARQEQARGRGVESLLAWITAVRRNPTDAGVRSGLRAGVVATAETLEQEEAPC